jgi:hypothetical protein
MLRESSESNRLADESDDFGVLAAAQSCQLH